MSFLPPAVSSVGFVWHSCPEARLLHDQQTALVGSFLLYWQSYSTKGGNGSDSTSLNSFYVMTLTRQQWWHGRWNPLPEASGLFGCISSGCSPKHSTLWDRLLFTALVKEKFCPRAWGMARYATGTRDGWAGQQLISHRSSQPRGENTICHSVPSKG